jgi:chromosomal replication initiation ATPase DnaA
MTPEVINGLIRSHQNMIGKLQKMLKNEPERKLEKKFPSDYIIQEVNNEFDCELRTHTRRKNIVYARHAAVFLLKRHTSLIWEDISIKVGNTDHTTAIHSFRSASNLIDTDEEYNLKVNNIKERLNILIN